MKLVWSSRFTRAAKKLARRKPELLDDLDMVLKQLEADPYHPSLRTHKLSGDFEGQGYLELYGEPALRCEVREMEVVTG